MEPRFLVPPFMISSPLCKNIVFGYKNSTIPLTRGVRDDTISLELIVSSGLLSRYRIYVKPFLLRAGAVFTYFITNRKLTSSLLSASSIPIRAGNKMDSMASGAGRVAVEHHSQTLCFSIFGNRIK